MSLVLVSSESTTLPITKEAARVSNLIASMLDDGQCEDNEIPVLNQSHEVLQKVVEFAEYYAHNTPMVALSRPLPYTDLNKCVRPEWYAQFVLNMDAVMLQHVAMAANFLDMPPLLDLTCGAIAASLSDKSVDELCEFFSLPRP